MLSCRHVRAYGLRRNLGRRTACSHQRALWWADASDLAAARNRLDRRRRLCLARRLGLGHVELDLLAEAHAAYRRRQLVAQLLHLARERVVLGLQFRARRVALAELRLQLRGPCLRRRQPVPRALASCIE